MSDEDFHFDDYVPRQIFTDEELAAPSLVLTKDLVKSRPKGECRHCGEYIGRGVAFHEKACKKQ